MQQLYLIHRNKHRKAAKMRKTEKHGPNERTEQNSRERAKQNGDKQSTRCRVQNTSYKDLKELSEDLNRIKKSNQK